MQPIDTTKYNIIRKDDGTLVRVDGLGNETPELTVDYCNSQIDYHTQVIENLKAQKAKIEEFLEKNPEPVKEEPVVG